MEMKLTSSMEKKEAEAKAAAVKHVINMLQRPGQLEKVEQYKQRVSHKKASVEALLKTAMQSQLDGVRVGLNQLHTCLQDIQDIKTSMQSIETVVKDVVSLCDKLQDVREENMKHSQYAIAMDNLKHIFTVPESVEKTKNWINEGKLLHAHQCLSDLENSRNDLLLELHKLPNQSQHDKIMLKKYFDDVEKLSEDMLKKQLRLILGRTLNTVRKEPTVIVTALRIIEREEKRDQEALKLEKQTGFLAPGRPKQWRKMAFEVLETAVATRIEGTQVDERNDNKLWLVTYLELTRKLILEDLRVVKTLCVPCFPPHYDIVNKFVNMYHSCLSKHFHVIIRNGLQGNEYVSLLSWVLNSYSGPELMQHPELSIDITNIGPLLSPETIEKLQSDYLANMKQNYREWMTNTLVSEKNEWMAEAPPEEGQNGYFRSAAPVIIFQMIDQNLQVTRTISQELTDKALLLSIDEVIRYGKDYRDSIIEFKNRHFIDRSQMPFFTHHMITIVNNCVQLTELSSQLKQQYWRPSPKDPLSTKFETVLNIYSNLRDEAGMFLLDEAFLDLDKHFEELFTSRWLTGSLSVDTICVTLEDYFQDYGHLCEENFEYVISEAQNLVAKRYITAMLQKKITFKTVEERKSSNEKISEEVKKIKMFFYKIAPNVTKQEQPFDAILMLSEVLNSEAEMISLDLHNLIDKYPDITEDHLNRLLSLRGDIPKNDAKEIITFAMEKRSSTLVTSKSIFKQIVLVDRIINW